MTTAETPRNEDIMATGLSTGDGKISSPARDDTQPASISDKTDRKDPEGTLKAVSPEGDPEEEPEAPRSQNQASGPLPVQPYPQACGYHFEGYSYPGANPSSLSSNEQVASIPYGSSTAAYIPQPGVFAAAQSSPFSVPSNATLSPPRTSKAVVIGIPPASPLFPRSTSTGMDNALPYISPAMGSSASPMTYHATYAGSTGKVESQGSSDEGSWDRGLNHNAYPSPQLSAHGMIYAMPRGTRAYSFDGETVLLPAMLDEQQMNPAYSPYNTSHLSPAGSAMFAAQQSWSYPGPPPDLYSTPASPLQPRASAHQMYTIGGPMQPMGSYGVPPQYFPATSPGPPIQTTASNKGPDGANLFVFHIPNNFTNMDMYNLFCRYGNLLSVRIMVERDTGRSRGFGFVSYDNAGSAAQAIQELNGYAIGNKRLKVQHKQIRSRDNGDRESIEGESYDHGIDEGNYTPTDNFSSLPPTAPLSNAENLWYEQHSEGVHGMNTGDSAMHAPNEDRAQNGNEVETSNAEQPGENAEGSPLTDMGTLQSALSAVSGESGN